MATASVIKTVYKTINAILSANDVSFNEVIAYHLNFLDHAIERSKEESRLWQKDASQRVSGYTDRFELKGPLSGDEIPSDEPVSSEEREGP